MLSVAVIIRTNSSSLVHCLHRVSTLRALIKGLRISLYKEHSDIKWTFSKRLELQCVHFVGLLFGGVSSNFIALEATECFRDSLVTVQ